MAVKKKAPAKKKAAPKKAATKAPPKTSAKVTRAKPSTLSGHDEADLRHVQAEIVGLDDDSDNESEPSDADIAAEAAEAGARAAIEDLDEASEADLLPAVDDENPRTVSSAAASPMVVDPVTQYMAELRKYPLLTREQEHELAIKYREHGDAKAAELLVTSNLRFVVKVAAEYSKFGARLIDLIQEGNVGLMHAVKEFNPYKGTRLITYAVWWIRGYIQEYLMRQYSMVRIGTTQNQRKLFYKLQKERALLEEMGRKPDYAALGERLGVSPEEVETMTKRMSGRDVSLNTPLDSEGGGSSLLDFESSGEEGADEQLGHHEELSALRHGIDDIRGKLNEKESYILDHRILADEPMTLQEIGDHFKVTREAVRQVEARLVQRIRDAYKATVKA